MAKRGYAITNRLDRWGGGWWATATLEDGRAYRVGVERGRMVRIPFKPRGQNRGWEWEGHVMDQRTARTVWCGKVSGTIGVRGLLVAAGLLADQAAS